MTTMTRLLPLVLAVGAAACGNGESPAAPTPVTEDAPTLSRIQNMVFNESCTHHHGEDETYENLDLTAGQAHSNLVNEPSRQRPELDLVEPNDAENSYLIHKLEGHADIVGERMPPPDEDSLSAAMIDEVKAWIDAGAQNN